MQIFLEPTLMQNTQTTKANFNILHLGGAIKFRCKGFGFAIEVAKNLHI